MKTVKKEAIKIVAKTLGKMSTSYVEGWPPICATILHQPKRPDSKRK